MDEQTHTFDDLVDWFSQNAGDALRHNPKYRTRFNGDFGRKFSLINELPDPCIVAINKDYRAFCDFFVGYSPKKLREIADRYQLISEDDISRIEKLRRNRGKAFIESFWNSVQDKRDELSV